MIALAVVAGLVAVVVLGLASRLLQADPATYIAALVVVVCLLVFAFSFRILFRPSGSPGLFSPLTYAETDVVVFLRQAVEHAAGFDQSAEFKRPLYRKAKTWTVDAAGNLTIWTADAARATYPAGSWVRIERMDPRTAEREAKSMIEEATTST